MIDWNRVQDLKSDFGEDDFEELLVVFLDEVETAITDFQDDGKTEEKTRSQMHFLKGCAANVGFSELASLASSIEEGGVFDGMEASVRQVFEQSKTALMGASHSSL